MTRKIVVTSALPYANGPIHIGHLVEYLQTDIWVRFQKLCGNECYYFCADDTHGTPVMLSAKARGISPEELIESVHKEHLRDFEGFGIEFDNYYSTHSDENRQFSEMIYQRAVDKGVIAKRDVEQAYCENEKMWLPDRYVKGTCPRCRAEDQYGDSCDKCGAHYSPTDLIDPYCSSCGEKPVRKQSLHYFFELGKFEDQLKKLMGEGYVQESVKNKLQEWFDAGLRDWDISRNGPYFGFRIPGEDDKYFYVWLDAPIGYMASCKNYCDRNGLDFDKVWDSDEYELYHFIGKDIMYFHALFWPALLICAGVKHANKLFVHGFLTVNGQKMSKSKGTFVMAETYLKHLNPEYLRYYYCCKLSGGVEDIDLNFEDFISRINSDVVGKYANLASRSGPMISKKLDGKLGELCEEGKGLVARLQQAKADIISDYESLNYAAVTRRISALADASNKFVDDKQPWVTIKTDQEATRQTLTAVINAVRILTIYLKPILPIYAGKIEKFLDSGPLTMDDTEKVMENVSINQFERLIDRIEKEKVDSMVDESMQQSGEPNQEAKIELAEPIEPECTIEDVMKVDLRIAKITKAESVEGADKLLALELDLGALKKNVFAGIAKAYDPADLVGKTVVCVANLKPRKMRFGTSEGMILAAGPGGSEIFMLSADQGATPGLRVH